MRVLRSAVNPLTAWLAAAALLGGAAASASERQAGEGDWVPSFAFVTLVTAQHFRAYVDSQNLTTDQPLRPSATGTDLAVTPFVGGQIQIMTPALPKVPLRPRLFLNAEIVPYFASQRRAAQEGSPTGLSFPDNDAYGQDAVGGQGSTTQTQVKTLGFGAAAGLSFPLEIFGRDLRVKPYAGWIRQEIQTIGKVIDALCADNGDKCTAAAGGALREINLRDSRNDWIDAFGPGLELEMDTGRIGPVGTSLFGGFGAYRLMSDRSWRMSKTETVGPDLVGPETEYQGNWRVKLDQWIYRGAIGMRFQWLGDSE